MKITYYSLDCIKKHETKTHKGTFLKLSCRKCHFLLILDLLWTAPEIIREPVLTATKEGDIYSLAIVCSEIVTKKSAWDLENSDYDLEGTILGYILEKIIIFRADL